jgi:hypothetical protein
VKITYELRQIEPERSPEIDALLVELINKEIQDELDRCWKSILEESCRRVSGTGLPTPKYQRNSLWNGLGLAMV